MWVILVMFILQIKNKITKKEEYCYKKPYICHSKERLNW